MNKSLITLALVLIVVTTGAQAERRGRVDRVNLCAGAQDSCTRQIE